MEDEMKRYRVKFVMDEQYKYNPKTEKRLLIKQYYDYGPDDLPRWEENGEAQVILNEDEKTVRISGIDGSDGWAYIYLNRSELLEYIKRLKKIAEEVE